MEEIQNEVEVVINNVNSKGIIIRNREEIHEKSKNIKPTEYYLDVGDQGTGDEADETQFVTVQNDEGAQFVTVEVADSDQLILPDKEVILWNEICRVCANGSDKEFIPIFSGEGLEHDISNKIHTYLPLRVSENDTLPLQVCYNCAATMVAWDEIFRGCIDAQQRLTELQSKLNLKDHQYYNDSSVEEENMETVLEVETTNNEEPQVEAKDVENLDTLQIVETNRCSSSQSSKTNILNKQKRKNLEINRNKKKLIKKKKSNSTESPCRMIIEVKDNINKDLPKEPAKKINSLIKNKSNADNKRWIITQVTENFNKMVKIPGVTKQKTVISKKAYYNKKEYWKMVKVPDSCSKTIIQGSFNKLTKSSIMNIDDCSTTEVITDALEREIETEINTAIDPLESENPKNIERVNWMKIDECAKSSVEFTDPLDVESESSEVEIHKEESSTIKPEDVKIPSVSYVCTDCGKIFKFKDTLNRHRRIHSGERPFTCHICGKQFRDSGGLCRHVRDVHAKVKKWPCSICNRNFAAKATRDDHERTHTGERPYVCHSCGKSFKSKASLYIHAKIHTDLFPHPCMHCQKRFRRRQEMLAHMTTHTDERNFECKVCFKSFRMKIELRRHALSHSDEKPFACDLCNFKCKQKRYLNNHVKHKHSLIDQKSNEGSSA